MIYKGGKLNKNLLTALFAALIALAAIALTAGNLSYAVSAGEEQRDIYFCDGTMQSNPRQFNQFRSVGFRFEVPEGYKLNSFTILASPTWGLRDNAGFTADIYEWNGSYDQSIEGMKLGSCSISNHVDNASVTLEFGYIPAGMYLIHIHNFTDAIGTWEYMALPEEYVSTWAYFQNGVEEIEYLPGTAISVSRDASPHKITPSPEPSETAGGDEQTEEITPEATPKATRGRITSSPESDKNDSGKNGAGLTAGIISAVVMAAATVIVIALISKRGKR